MSSRLDKTIAAGLLVALVFTALAQGAVEDWSVALFQLLIAALLPLWALKVVIEGRLTIQIPAVALPLAALVALGLAQSVSITDGSGRSHSLSMDVEATRSAVTVLVFLLASLLIAANFLATPARLGLLANLLTLFGLMLAVFALAQHFAWDGRMYWLTPTKLAVFGPFVNRNHFAGFMEMLIPIPIALIVARGVSRERWAFYGFAAAVMGLAVVVSLSRGGITSLAAGLAFMAAMSTRIPRLGSAGPRARGRAARLWMGAGAVCVISVAILAGVVWIGAEPLIDRAAETVDEVKAAGERPDYYSRQWLWKDTLSMIRANPVTGVGLGAYETAYPIYAHSDGSLLVSQAHNDYLQVVADGGVVGGALALWFIVAVITQVARGVRSRAPLEAALALASGAGIVSVLVHSLFDFNLQLPSNALLFLLLSAVASQVAAARERTARASVAPRAAGHSVSRMASGVSI
jgi:O-antigen ligase